MTKVHVSTWWHPLCHSRIHDRTFDWDLSRSPVQEPPNPIVGVTLRAIHRFQYFLPMFSPQERNNKARELKTWEVRRKKISFQHPSFFINREFLISGWGNDKFWWWFTEGIRRLELFGSRRLGSQKALVIVWCRVLFRQYSVEVKNYSVLV